MFSYWTEPHLLIPYFRSIQGNIPRDITALNDVIETLRQQIPGEIILEPETTQHSIKIEYNLNFRIVGKSDEENTHFMHEIIIECWFNYNWYCYMSSLIWVSTIEILNHLLLDLMLLLGGLVRCGVFGSRCAVTERCVAVLCNFLVALLWNAGEALLDWLGGGVCCVFDGIHCDWFSRIECWCSEYWLFDCWFL